MQEFNYPLTELLTKGLRPKDYISRNSPYLEVCKNLAVTEFGLREPEGVLNPFVTTPTGNWPYPQFIKGPGVTLLLDSNYIYTVSDSWSTQRLYTKNYRTLQDEDIILSGACHLADFGKFWILFTGNSVIFTDNWHGMFGENNPTLVCNDRTIGTGTAFNGRLILAGFNPSNFWDDQWQSVIDYWMKEATYDVSYALSMQSNYVWWSSIGGGDALSMFYPDRAVTGNISEDARMYGYSDMFMELFRRNEFGFMPMPWTGTVLCLKQLGKGIMAYGDHGIAYLYPVVGSYPTFGMQPVASFGISGRGAIGGDSNRHLFQDPAGDLWTITPDLIKTRLGYKEYLVNIIDGNPIISYDPSQEYYYIGGLFNDTTLGFLLTPNGLSQVPQAVTSACFDEGAFLGLSKLSSDEEVILTTGIIDLGVREDKTVGIIEVGLDTLESPYGDTDVCLYYRYSKSESFRQSPWVRLNDKGWERIQVTATEFKICLRVSSYIGTRIDSINVRWQLSNYQTVRGFSAAKINQ